MRIRNPPRQPGIIPAYAGSTKAPIVASKLLTGSSPHTRGAPLTVVRSSYAVSDHPRIRGEHSVLAQVDGGDDGIIPAYAGSTLNDLRNYTAFLNS